MASGGAGSNGQLLRLYLQPVGAHHEPRPLEIRQATAAEDIARPSADAASALSPSLPARM